MTRVSTIQIGRRPLHILAAASVLAGAAVVHFGNSVMLANLW